MSNSQIKSAVLNIKNEITMKKKDIGTTNSNTSPKTYNLCMNTLTKVYYTFQKGSTSEKDLYRVMPRNGPEKLYFENEDEYDIWRMIKKH